jgi:hypothetical protein
VNGEVKMKNLCGYTNKNGESFQLVYEIATTPPDATYCGFWVVAKCPVGRGHSFKVFVEKKAAAKLEDAIEFVKKDPVAYIKNRLDEVVNGQARLVFRPILDGWSVI